MRLRSFSAKLASWKIDASVGMVIEVSTILCDGVVILEGHRGAGLGGHASTAGGDVGRVGSFSSSVGILFPKVSGIGGILRRTGQNSRVLSRDSIA